ncbi:MAG: 3-phosphoglycerate dehydrogenase [Deltaproteobacteria bacterium]|nr:3-phosphoglycerate dehydrogenase [Deltaproteobacteria bacterium]
MKILVSDPLHEKGVEIFQAEGFEVEVKTGLSPEDLRQAIKGVDGLVIRSATKVDQALLEAADQLKVVGRAGTGLDNVDIPAATTKGVVVMNTPGQNSNAAAELAMAHIFAISRHIGRANVGLRAGKWEKKQLRGREVKGKTLGIIGMGNIGRILAELGQGCKMKVVGYDPFLNADDIAARGAEPLTLDQLLAVSDYISIHVPKTKETSGLFNAATFGKMKKGAIIINCARGGIVVEEDLCDALEAGQLGGAALDVFEVEPLPSNSRLLYRDEVVCTPHLGANTFEAQENVAVAVAQQMAKFLKTGEAEFAVNAPK